MTDRKLLKLAAKAAGIEWCSIESLGSEGGYWKFFDGKTQAWWNPLTDDGDALRLAVKLGIAFLISNELKIAKTLSGDVDNGYVGASEEFNNDPYGATRRAIVRAAAKIGKGMK